MKHCRENPNATPDAARAARRGEAGFTLIEVMVVVAILGALSAAVAVNWSSFMRHQELRSEALAIHKDIAAQRARALEIGGDVPPIIIELGTNSYTIKELKMDAEGNPVDPIDYTSKEVTLYHATISTDNPSNISGLPWTAGDNNIWAGSNPTITIRANNLEAFKDDNDNKGGFLVIQRGTDTKRQFCIIKGKNNVRPEIYQRSGGGAWKKI
jgi:prepilin-type N-terminal cleavage/methylation domain-containing protein